ncbi:MAG: DUF2157 domain-containing protein [bacterium]|nr:DUF2157 domain-containing protein [bacterium]
MPDQKIIDQINQERAQGKAKEQVYLTLLQNGLKIDEINENYILAVPQASAEGDLEKIKKESQSNVIRIIITIAAILVAVGIFSFVAANWQGMSKAMKLIIVIGAMLGAYGSGWYLQTKKGLNKTGSALIFLGSLIYGAAIFLVAQMFHIRANWPDGFLLWMFGVLAIAHALKSYLYHVLALILGIVSIFGHPFKIFSSFTGNDPFLLTSSSLLLVATIVIFVFGLNFYREAKQERP